VTGPTTQPSYDVIGVGYAERRVADPRIEAQLWAALGDARSVLTVGAGAGSYEPPDREVVALEPSLVQLAQRPPDRAPAVRGVAGALPFPDASFDACLATLTLHHWPDWRAGIRELRRVARKRIVILTHDTSVLERVWLTRDYFPQIADYDRPRFPSLTELEAALGSATTEAVPIPSDCTDGFLFAHWRHPERYLDPAVRAASSGFLLLQPEELDAGLTRLALDLESGEWARRNAYLLDLEAIDGGYRLVVGSQVTG
jgi:SAM-dependent methyltransferase